MLLIQAYSQLNKIDITYRAKIIGLFSEIASKICEGQQMDIDFESKAVETIKYEDYLLMITLKTSVLLGAADQFGAIIGGLPPAAKHRDRFSNSG